jgi:hypothetical protein
MILGEHDHLDIALKQPTPPVCYWSRGGVGWVILLVGPAAVLTPEAVLDFPSVRAVLLIFDGSDPYPGGRQASINLPHLAVEVLQREPRSGRRLHQLLASNMRDQGGGNGVL